MFFAKTSPGEWRSFGFLVPPIFVVLWVFNKFAALEARNAAGAVPSVVAAFAKRLVVVARLEVRW